MESESGISFTEFTYQLLQGYDFVHLAKEHGVRMQVRVDRGWGWGVMLARAALPGNSLLQALLCCCCSVSIS